MKPIKLFAQATAIKETGGSVPHEHDIGENYQEHESVEYGCADSKFLHSSPLYDTGYPENEANEIQYRGTRDPEINQYAYPWSVEVVKAAIYEESSVDNSEGEPENYGHEHEPRHYG